MKSPRHPDRRAFLQGALSTVAGAALAGGCVRDTPHDDGAVPLPPALLPTLGAERLHAIGQAYLRAAPAESTVAALRAAIGRDRRQYRDLPWSPLPSLEALIASDFAADRVVYPAGWMLSVNEARQCALFALQG